MSRRRQLNKLYERKLTQVIAHEMGLVGNSVDALPSRGKAIAEAFEEMVTVGEKWLNEPKSPLNKVKSPFNEVKSRINKVKSRSNGIKSPSNKAKSRFMMIYQVIRWIWVQLKRLW